MSARRSPSEGNGQRTTADSEQSPTAALTDRVERLEKQMELLHESVAYLKTLVEILGSRTS